MGDRSPDAGSPQRLIGSPWMIDLHLHLLPAIDDGAASLDVTREMLVLARVVGFSTLVATPHLDGPITDEYRSRVAAAWSEVAPLAAAEGVQVALGYEIKLAPDLVHRLDRGEPVTLAGGRAVLVELPFVGWPNYTEQSLFDLLAAGYRPLLAHPERYVDAHRDVDRLIRLADSGVLLQVTFGSLVGLFGKQAREVAEEVLRRDAAAVLATDAHSAGKRFETVRQGGARAKAIVGQARYRQLVADNPEALLHDRPLPVPAPMTADDDVEGGWRSAIRRFGRKVGF
jgi:protein-tyrosine phosphatase